MDEVRTACCIVGGGPAGMMAGFLLARAGVDVTVLEKHADFFRDFRGDTIHPSTMQMLFEAGLLERFLSRPHDEVQRLAGQVGEDVVHIADFDHLPTICKFIAFMPQWDFLDFLRDEAATYPAFHLRMQTECTDIISEDGRVAGICARGPHGLLTIRADLVLAADGRHSVVRERARLPVRKFGAPMDVLWMHVPKGAGDTAQTLGFAGAGRILILIDRKSYWQAGFVIAKDTYTQMRANPIGRLHEEMVALAPFLRDRVNAVSSWDDVSFLEVRVDRLERWYRAGLLCIGDAAHAMSPIGGVGINLAIQDAVAAANLLWEPLAQGRVGVSDLRAVQRRRQFPTAATQSVQLFVQRFAISALLRATRIVHAPRILKVVTAIAFFRRTAGRLIGLGFRPERIRSPIRAQTSQPPAQAASRSV